MVGRWVVPPSSARSTLCQDPCSGPDSREGTRGAQPTGRAPEGRGPWRMARRGRAARGQHAVTPAHRASGTVVGSRHRARGCSRGTEALYRLGAAGVGSDRARQASSEARRQDRRPRHARGHGPLARRAGPHADTDAVQRDLERRFRRRSRFERPRLASRSPVSCWRSLRARKPRCSKPPRWCRGLPRHRATLPAEVQQSSPRRSRRSCRSRTTPRCAPS
jgi:hypothetical protein